MSGHGHVNPNPDGSKARCGGPAICPVCARELGAEQAAIAAKLRSPAYSRHLMTIEAGPANELDPDSEVMAFVSRCICGHNIPWGPYQQTMAAIRGHLVSAGLIGA
jgi:hypothetical protein